VGVVKAQNIHVSSANLNSNQSTTIITSTANNNNNNNNNTVTTKQEQQPTTTIQIQSNQSLANTHQVCIDSMPLSEVDVRTNTNFYLINVFLAVLSLLSYDFILLSCFSLDLRLFSFSS